MTQRTSRRFRAVQFGVAAMLLLSTAPAHAQIDPGRPLPDAPPPRTSANSTLAGNVASPEERRETRTLAAAVFAKPAAATRAADKASAAVQPDLSAVQPKENWANSGPHIHKKGVQVTAPF